MFSENQDNVRWPYYCRSNDSHYDSFQNSRTLQPVHNPCIDLNWLSCRMRFVHKLVL